MSYVGGGGGVATSTRRRATVSELPRCGGRGRDAGGGGRGDAVLGHAPFIRNTRPSSMEYLEYERVISCSVYNDILFVKKYETRVLWDDGPSTVVKEYRIQEDPCVG